VTQAIEVCSGLNFCQVSQIAWIPFGNLPDYHLSSYVPLSGMLAPLHAPRNGIKVARKIP
jgi:hypothetical protein